MKSLILAITLLCVCGCASTSLDDIKAKAYVMGVSQAQKYVAEQVTSGTITQAQADQILKVVNSVK